jgi:dihydrodipicolinate synthase/N-acetylneuraminate lyase
MSLKCLYTALVAPVLNEAVEFGDFKKLIQRQAHGGVDGTIVEMAKAEAG